MCFTCDRFRDIMHGMKEIWDSSKNERPMFSYQHKVVEELYKKFLDDLDKALGYVEE